MDNRTETSQVTHPVFTSELAEQFSDDIGIGEWEQFTTITLTVEEIVCLLVANKNENGRVTLPIEVIKSLNENAKQKLEIKHEHRHRFA